MNYVGWAGKLFSNVKGFYNEINPATLTGAIDVIVVRQEDGSYCTSPWHIRFGKTSVLVTKQNVVDIEINGEPTDLHMKLGEAGEAFFVLDAETVTNIPSHHATPLPLSHDNLSLKLAERGLTKTKTVSVDLQSEQATPVVEYGDTIITMEGTNVVVSGLPVVKSSPDFVGGSGVHFQHEKFSLDSSTQTDLTGDDIDRSKIDGSMTEMASIKRALLKDRSPPNGDVSSVAGNNVESPRSKSSKLDSSEECLFEMEMDEMDDTVAQPPDAASLGRCLSLPEINLIGVTEEEWQNRILSKKYSICENDNGSDAMCPVGSLPSCSKSFANLDPMRFDVNSQTCLTGDKFIKLDDVKWEWGEFPETSPSTTASVPTASRNPEPSTSKLKTDKLNSKGTALEQGGIYLDDLNQDDPELVGLYLYNQNSRTLPKKLVKDEDSESGHGVSLPQSPVSFDTDSSRVRASSFTGNILQEPGLLTDVAMSLCGGLEDPHESSLATKFNQNIITYESFSTNPNVLADPLLVVRISGKYYKWSVAGPLLMSLLIYNRPVTDAAKNALMKQHMPKKEQRRRWLGGWFGGRGETEIAAATVDTKDVASSLPSTKVSSLPSTPSKTRESVRTDGEGLTSDDETDTLLTSTKSVQVNAPEKNSINSSPNKEKYWKSLKLSSEQIAKLNLMEGMNEATFSVTTQYQGTTRCSCCIYLWNWNDRVVVSDIDGTITKSDVLGQVLPMIGHVLPMIGSDWSQVGIANLYSMIHHNGYKFLYLSARAIGQSKITKDYLRGVRQGDDSLPDGPLLLSPSSLRSAFHKEVIERKPEEFKISCLRDIIDLFPGQCNPFTAGFGNRINDVWAYTAVGVQKARIFLVNHKGQLHIETSTFKSTYTKLSDIVDQLFPPITTADSRIHAHKISCASEYSTFNYWRDPLPVVELEVEVYLKQAAADKKAGKRPFLRKPTESSRRNNHGVS